MREEQLRREGEESDDEVFEESSRKRPLWKRVLSLLKNDHQSSWSGVGRDIVSRSRGVSRPHRFIIYPDDW